MPEQAKEAIAFAVIHGAHSPRTDDSSAPTPLARDRSRVISQLGSSIRGFAHFDGQWITSHENWPIPRGITTSRPVAYGASVRAWHARHNATNQSKSKSEPPCERFRTWCTSNRVRRPQAWHVQRDRARTVPQIISHAGTEAA